MNSNICNNCGGEYEYRNGRWICRACGALKPEEISNEEVTLLYTAYQKLRLADFDEAEKEFDDIVLKYPKNPNGYWGRLMAKYGIKYEQDFDGRMIPTCYATSIEGLYFSADYKKALEYADENTRAYYREQAGYIERVRREWIEKAVREKPYDIFLCYKDSDLANGIERTQDSLAVQELYIHLTNKGYRVFYSHESLRDKVGEKYEPYIFRALSTAKVMLVYGSKPEYITSTWLKNEWTRYDKRIKAGEKKPESLLVACDGFSPSELPSMLSSRQCFNAKDRSFYSDLDETIEKIIFNKTGGVYPFEAKKKSKAPFYITMLLLLALAAGIYAFPLLKEETVQTVTNSSYQSTIYMNDGQFPKGTEFRMKEVLGDTYFLSMASSLAVNQNNWHFYDMELWYDGEEYDPDGNVTVTLPIPAGMSEENVVVYYMSGSRPQKISANASGGKVTFITNHFSVYMIAEETVTCSHEILIDPAIEATCTSEGLTEGKHCSLCGEVLVAQTVVPKSDHDYRQLKVEKPTCTERGFTTFVCNCGDEYQGNYVEALGHKPDKNATCTQSSHCTVCGELLESAGGHIPGNSATCVTAQTCVVCKVELSPATGHHYTANTTAATCTASGFTTYSCSCGDSYVSDYTSPLGHTLGEGATCTESSYCTVCGQLMESAGGHIPGNRATCTTAQTCTVCGEELTAALGHTPGEDATCTTAQTCTVCGEELVAALGHTPGEDATCTTAQTCTVCGEELTAALGHTPGEGATCTTAQTCTVCGEELSPATGHNYESVVVAPTCTEQGYTTYTCACGDTYTDNYVEADGHTLGEDATCTTAQTCTVCGEELVAALGHTPGEDATCTESSNCVVCGELMESAGGHIPGISATCTTAQTCVICNEELASALGHTPGEDATCTTAQTCTVCGEELASATGHNYESAVTAPTCIEQGYTTYTCACGDTYTDNYVSALGHTAGEWEIVTEATESEAGLKVQKCTACGETINEETIPATGGNESVNASQGLEFTSNGDGTCYVSGIGTCTDIDIVIPSEYNGMKVTSIGDSAFYNCPGLTSVTIPDSVTSIGDDAFYNCSGLTSVTISDSVTSIGNYAFAWCSGLTSVTIPDSVTSIGSAAFVDCEGLTSVTIPDSVTSIGSSAFESCEGLTRVTIGNGVTSIGQFAFSGCSSLTSVTIPDSVTSIGEEAFSWCDGLTSVTIGDGVTSIGESAFFNCFSLTSVTIPDSVMSIGDYAFYNCYGLTSVTIPDSVTSIGSYAFYYCSALTDVYYTGTETDWASISIGSSNDPLTSAMIHYNYVAESPDTNEFIFTSNGDGTCTLAGVGTNTASDLIIPSEYNGMAVTAIGQTAFRNCLNLTSVTIPGSIETIDKGAFYDCKNLTSVTISEGVTKICSSAFRNCVGLTNIIIPNTVTEMEAGVFSGCANLASMTLPIVDITFNTQNATSAQNTALSYAPSLFSALFGTDAYEGSTAANPFSSSATALAEFTFYVPNSLKEIILTSGTTISSGSFAGFENLTSISIPSSVTSIKGKALLLIVSGSFANCSALTEIHYDGTIEQWQSISLGSSWDNNSGEYTIYCLDGTITKAGEATKTPSEGLEFTSNGDGTCYVSGIGTCTDTDVVIPSEYNGMAVTGIGFDAFRLCDGLTNVVIPDSVTSIGQQAFYGCSGLKSMTIGHEVTSIGAHAFYNCSDLRSIEIPDSVTSIGGYAFSGCSSLISVDIPDSVTSIGAHAFYSCSGLTSVTIPDSVTSIGEAAFRCCDGLTAITVDENNEYYCSIDGVLFDKSVTTIICYPAGKQETEYVLPSSVTSIGSYVFYECDDLTGIEIPDGVTSIGASAFNGCTNLTSVEIPEGVTSIGFHAFRNCSSLTNITIPSGVTGIVNSVFAGCSGLTSIVIPDTVTAITGNLLSLVPGAFDSCTNLTEIHYEGTVDQWHSISLGSGWNTSTGEYTIYCTDGEISKDGIITMY